MTVRRPRAGIDLDNVLYDWESYARYLLRTWWDLDLPVSADYDAIQRACGPDRWAALFDAGVRQLGLFSDGNILVDAAQVLPAVAATHDVVILTRRPRHAIRDTHEWLSRHLVHPSEVVIFHGDSSRTKSDVPCDWYVDDSAAEVEERILSIPTDASERKAAPLCTGVLDYFPDALLEVARVSRMGNEQHHPGSPLHWDKSKSTDEADALARHLLQRGTRDTDGARHSAKVAWRALALLQRELDAEAAREGEARF